MSAERIAKVEQLEKIAATAWDVAFRRSFSDIKYAKEIFEELDRTMAPANDAERAYMDIIRAYKELAPQFEARYKIMDKLIAAEGARQVLELASGLAGRGLAMTEDLGIEYVEVDLPAMAARKRELLETLFEKGMAEPRGNLHIEAGNVLDESSLFAAAQRFKAGPIAVINEGLLRYLSFEEKAALARGIRALLERSGGVWITPDITLKQILSYENHRSENREKVKAMSGIDVRANSFESVADARKFFENLGFNVEEHPYREVQDELVSPARVGVSGEELERMIGPLVAFVMRVKK